MPTFKNGAKGKVEKFAAANPVFTREHFRRDLFRGQPKASADSLLRYHTATGRFRHVAPGVYASVPAHLDAQKYQPDILLVASLIREDGVIGFHAALDLHGLAYSSSSEVQVISHGRPGVVATSFGDVRFVRPPSSMLQHDAESLGIATIDRRGLQVRVTALERTLVDCLERPALGGGVEEVVHALWTVDAIDVDLIVDLVTVRDNRVLAGLTGWWLEQRMDDLLVEPRDLNRLRSLAPVNLSPALGAARKDGPTTASGWNVLLPAAITRQSFEGAPDEGPEF